jgi:hypothetical protein
MLLRQRMRNKGYRTWVSSRPYVFSNADTIPAGAKESYAWENVDTESNKHLPFTQIVIHNTSTTEDIFFYNNQNPDAKFYIPHSQTQTLSPSDINANWSFTIENAGSGNITANQIRIQGQRTASSPEGILTTLADSVFRRMTT